MKQLQQSPTMERIRVYLGRWAKDHHMSGFDPETFKKNEFYKICHPSVLKFEERSLALTILKIVKDELAISPHLCAMDSMKVGDILWTSPEDYYCAVELEKKLFNKPEIGKPVLEAFKEDAI